jgi:hypothetical protein
MSNEFATTGVAQATQFGKRGIFVSSNPGAPGGQRGEVLQDDGATLGRLGGADGVLDDDFATVGQVPTLAGGPTTVWDLDWSAQPSSGPLSSGPVTVGGVSMTVDNAPAASQLEIINGQGLVIVALAGVSRQWESLFNAPCVNVAIANLGAGDFSRPITVWNYFSAINVPSGSNQVAGAVYSVTSTGYNTVVSSIGRINSGGTVRADLQRTATHLSSTVPGFETRDVFVWRSSSNAAVDFLLGSWVGDWPAWTALDPAGFDPGLGAGTGMSPAILVRRQASRLAFFAATRASLGSPSFTLARSRIQLG